MRWLRFTWSALANYLYLFGLQDINQGWAFLQEQVICYLVTCVSGSKFDKVFLALLHRVGKVYIALCQLSCLTAEYLHTLYRILSQPITGKLKFLPTQK